LPLRPAAVSFVTKQKKPKIGLETKVSKDFLSANPLAIRNHNRRRGKLTDRRLRIAAAQFRR
jgi:hypothetical protein